LLSRAIFLNEEGRMQNEEVTGQIAGRIVCILHSAFCIVFFFGPLNAKQIERSGTFNCIETFESAGCEPVEETGQGDTLI
jgi:hypothetical protein